ncbi:HugZ family protein [Microvirga sp. 2MCAF38]|uniref:HugZ family pyridoxamine 5'-phosphate oxidase n=1 Tax=Microvirga sp. 2MCAF38 TaxID=3232989 RepID=UPI003F9CBC80
MDEPKAPEMNFDGVNLGRLLLRSIRAGALGTLDATGFPFTTLVTVATDSDGSPLILTSRLAAHTGNMERDPRVSLLLAQTGRGDPLAHPRLTIMGKAYPTTDPRARTRFLARNPKSRLYADFPDFSFWRIEILGGHLNGGFARAASLSTQDLKTDLTGAEGVVEAEAGAVAHMNQDHREALELYATRLAGGSPGAWEASGLDPEGIDLILGDQTARVLFPERATDAISLRRILKDLAGQARRREK